VKSNALVVALLALVFLGGSRAVTAEEATEVTDDAQKEQLRGLMMAVTAVRPLHEIEVSGVAQQDTERRAWQRKLDETRQKEKSRKTRALVGLIGGVGLTMIGPFTDTAATTWVGIGAIGFGGVSMISWKNAQQQRRQLEAEGRAKGYMSFYTPPQPQFVVTLSF